MDEIRQAQELSRYLDGLLEGGAGPADVDEEIEALGELGRSLSEVEFEPRPAHRAAVERLLQTNLFVKHQPAVQTGGTTMSRMIWGIPRRWFFGLLAVFVGGIVTMGGVALVVIVIAVALFFAPGAGTSPPALTIEVTTALPPAITVPTETVTASPVASLTIALTPSLTVTVTPTVTTAPSLTVVPTTTIVPPPTVTVSPTATVTATVAPSLTVTATPTPTVTVTPTEPTVSGLAFHPAHLNAGGKCRESYAASGSLKNHGGSAAAGVEIGYEVIAGGAWVERVEVRPSHWAQLGTDKPARFTVHVYVNDAWSLAGQGAEIRVRLFVQNGEDLSEGGSTEAIFVVRNQCKVDRPDKPARPEKHKKPHKGG